MSRVIILLLPTWLIWLFVSQYLLCARFQFDEPVPFQGDKIHNPYDSIESKNWVKCNFHAHSKAWNGATNGHGTAADIHDAYQKLEYKIHCVSNYHCIDTTNLAAPGYIPAYEHGYNLRKTHQLVLENRHVQWLDYFFPQTLHNKQHVLQQLSSPNSVVILNHPGLRNGYLPEDFGSLSGYDCMEVLNPSIISTREWDAALSSGKKTFIVGNDDIHNVVAKQRLGIMCTFVNVSKENGHSVLQALKMGKSYGAVLGVHQPIDSIPALLEMTVQDDTLAIKMNSEAEIVTLTGQNGRELASFTHTSTAHYKVEPTDHYVRATFTYKNGTTIYLNPVFYSSDSAPKDTLVYENIKETTFFRTMGVILLFLWLLLVWRIATKESSRHYRQSKRGLQFR